MQGTSTPNGVLMPSLIVRILAQQPCALAAQDFAEQLVATRVGSPGVIRTCGDHSPRTLFLDPPPPDLPRDVQRQGQPPCLQNTDMVQEAARWRILNCRR